MIFKTFDSNIDKTSSKWGMFGRSFHDIGTAIIGRITDINKALQATNGDLIGSFKDSDSILKRLYPGKEPIKEQLTDVDSLIPEINKHNFDFDGWIDELNNIDKQVKAGTLSWQDYSNGLNNNQKWIAKWGQETEGQIRTQSDFVEANKQARASVLAQNEALKAQTLSAKAGRVALQTLATAGNMLLMWGISKVITFVAKSIDEYVHHTEKLKKAAEDAKSAIRGIRSGFHSLSSKTDDVKWRYAELAQEIENIGKVNQSRGTLNTEDYEEFLSLSNQLAELFPELAVSYDDNGNAILNLSGNIDTIVGSLDNLVSAQRKLANQQILEKMPDVWAGYTASLDEYQQELESAQEKKSSFLSALAEIDQDNLSTLTLTDADINRSILQALTKIGIDPFSEKYSDLYKYTVKYIGSGVHREAVWDSSTWDFSALDDTQIEQLKNALSSLG